VYDSSPKNHAQPEGVFNDLSVNWTSKGTEPDVGEAVKFANGVGAALAKPKSMTRPKRNKQYRIVLIPSQARYISDRNIHSGLYNSPGG
jgi:hypothetical protein